jgi:hypothetical protein
MSELSEMENVSKSNEEPKLWYKNKTKPGSLLSNNDYFIPVPSKQNIYNCTTCGRDFAVSH